MKTSLVDYDFWGATQKVRNKNSKKRVWQRLPKMAIDPNLVA
jgi:hypothetical protein